MNYQEGDYYECTDGNTYNVLSVNKNAGMMTCVDNEGYYLSFDPYSGRSINWPDKKLTNLIKHSIGLDL